MPPPTGRPRIYEEPRVQFRIRLPKPLHAAIRDAADDAGLSLSRLFERLAEAHLATRARAEESTSWDWRQ